MSLLGVLLLAGATWALGKVTKTKPKKRKKRG